MVNNLRPIPDVPHSISAAAKALDTEEEFLVKWMHGGEIRACVDYVDLDHLPSYTCAYINGDANFKEAHRQYLEGDSPTTNTYEDKDKDKNGYYPEYYYGNDVDNCPLSSIFSTAHSKINLISFNLHDTEFSGQLGAYIQGLWQIDIEAIKDVFNRPSKDTQLINVVPYIPEGLYHSHINKTQGGYISGFIVDIGIDDIRISYDDMMRLSGYLNGQNELISLTATNKVTKQQHIKKETRKRAPNQNTKTVIKQLIAADPNLGIDIFEKPYAALEKIDDIRKEQGLEPLALETDTLARIIKEG